MSSLAMRPPNYPIQQHPACSENKCREENGINRPASRTVRTPFLSPKRVSGKHKFPDDFSANQMFLDDALQHFRRAGVIPDALGINDGNRPARADAQAIGLGAVNQGLRLGQVQFLQPPLQKWPRGLPLFLRAAFW